MSWNRYSFFLLLLLFISCASESENDPTVGGAVEFEEGYIPHPVPEKMPHPDVEPEKLELQDDSEAILAMHESLQLLHSFLNDESQDLNKKELTLFVSSQYSFHAASLDHTALVILDERADRLIQYHLLEDNYSDLAPKGRGPGDILFTKEMQLYDNRAYIAMQGFRISVFDCQPGNCEYEYTINTDFNNYSLAPSEDQLIVLGLSPFGGDQDTDPENTDQYALHQLKEDGQVEQSFSIVYQHRAPIVREQMNSGGTVRSFPEYDTHVVMYDFFPYIYLYDNETELKKKFEIPGFIQGYYDYNDDDLRGYFRHNDNTNVTNATKIDSEWILIQLRNREGLHWVEDHGLEGNEWHSYYAFNVNSHRLYKIGEDTIRSTENLEDSRTIFHTNHGLVVNEQGTLYWVAI